MGTCNGSEKWDKRNAQRRLRRGVKRSLEGGREVPLLREISDVWCFNKDGKTMFSDPKWFRK